MNWGAWHTLMRESSKEAVLEECFRMKDERDAAKEAAHVWFIERDAVATERDAALERAEKAESEALSLLKRVADAEGRVDGLKAELDLAESFHRVAVSERELAWHQLDKLKQALAHISLLRNDNTSSTSERVEAMGRYAHDALARAALSGEGER